MILIDVILEIMSFDGRICAELALKGFVFGVPNHVLFESRALDCFVFTFIAFEGFVSGVRVNMPEGLGNESIISRIKPIAHLTIESERLES